MNSQEFRAILFKEWPELSDAQQDRIAQFRDRVVRENNTQNLTNLLEPSDFYYGHVEDVKRLLQFSGLEFPAVDLGSGCGVPGLLAGLLRQDVWVLIDSERRKAAFLAETVRSFDLERTVSVISDRAEQWLGQLPPRHPPVKSIVARAVGPVDRIYGWLRRCSSWNNLVLLKGPGWQEEWKSFLASPYGSELQMAEEYRYTTGPEAKVRVIVRINRVPRGTTSN